jgi:hypothetical protein
MTVSAAGQARGNVVLERLLAQAGWTPERLGAARWNVMSSRPVRARLACGSQ